MMIQTNEIKNEAWVRICRLDDILPNTGVCCLLGREQVAVYRIGTGNGCRALGNFDPFSRANVLARGLVGDRGGRLKVSSPIYKQSFCLETGVCLDDPSVRIPTYDVRITAGHVELKHHATRAPRSGNIGVVTEIQSR